MKKITIRTNVFLLSLLLLSLANFALAADLIKQPVEIGRMRIKPTFKYSTSFTQNVELNRDPDQKYRLAHDIKPGIIAQMPFERAYVESGYQYEYFLVNGYKGQGMHSANGLIRYDLSETASLGLSDNFSTSALDFTGNTTFQFNTADISLAKQLNNRASTNLRYAYQTYKGPSSDRYADYNDQGISLDMSYRLSPLTTLTPDFQYHHRRFRNDNVYSGLKDYDSYSGQIAISRMLTSRVSASINGGYTQRDYKEGTSGSGALYGAGMNARLTNFSQLSLNYQHAILDTFNPLEKKTLQTDSPFLNNEIIASQLRSDYRQVISDRIVTNLNYKLTEKDIFDLGFTYSWNWSGSSNILPGSANNQDLDEEAYTIGLGYSRKILKWVSLSARGAYGSKKTNSGSYYYKAFGGGLGLDIAF
ncbi:MAG: hypothetical protein KJ880_06375 [Candidatus Omnitrophica bacterium]|nr:hypothetical protein [Candidatus Omnitrophota bacterium]MBU1870156.1 hypothetical protein [Candidatus Omnitrophota bacterium]